VNPSSLFRKALPFVFLATAAAAQDFEGLDLSEEKPTTPVEFRPTLGVLSVKAADTEEVSASRARQLEAELLKQLGQGDLFQTVVEPSSARSTLGADFAKTDACTDYSCMEAAAKKLKVHRLVRLTVQKHGVGSSVTMYGYDPGFNEVLVVSQESGEKAEKTFLGVAGKTQQQKDREFLKKINPFIVQVQKTLSIPNGKIVVDNDPSGIVTVDNAENGMGSVEVIAQRGTRTVKVTSPGYKPFEQTVTVESGKSVDVKVQLVALPLAEVVVVKPVEEPKGGIFTKPGLYIAVAGAAAIAIGVAYGQSAQGVKTKLEAGGDPVALTRAEAKAAPTSALLANILVGAGAAAVAGGVTWIILTPSDAPPAPAPVPKTGTGEPTESVTPVPSGAMIKFGGSF
jgi:hypothetical protein